MTPPSLPSILPSSPAVQDCKLFFFLIDLFRFANISCIVTTTGEQFQAAVNLGKVTAPDQFSSLFLLSPCITHLFAKKRTAIFICGFQGIEYTQVSNVSRFKIFSDCLRLYPTRDRLMVHRKRDHDSQDDRLIITWNVE